MPEIEGYFQEIKPVTLYLNDLRWIETKLSQTDYYGKLEVNFHELIDIPNIDTLVEWSGLVGVDTLDYLLMEFGFFNIDFYPEKTVIAFPENNINTLLLVDSLVPFLLSKENQSGKQNTKIFLFERPKNKNFWLQDKTPLWLSVLLALIPIVISIIALIRK